MGTTRLTLDTSDFDAELELQGDVAPEVVQAISEVLEAGNEVGRIEGPSASGGGARELRFSLKVSDRLRDRLAALRARDVDGAIERIGHTRTP